MKSRKSKIIKKYGTDVEVRKYSGSSIVGSEYTKALLGRGSRSRTNLKGTENTKEGIFLPKLNVSNGDYVINSNHGEDYLVISLHKEYEGNTTLSKVAGMYKCRHKMTVKGNTYVADDRGNLKTTFGVKYQDVPCYLEEVTNELRQYEPGISPDTEYRIYVTDLEIEEVDQVVLTLFNKEETFKVIATDYISFPDLLVLEVNRDIRK